MIHKLLKKPPDEYAGFIKDLKDIFQGMHYAYEEAAEAYSFCCNGCEDSCCRTRFYHHTLLEYVYLYEGYRRLARDTRENAIKRAQIICAEYKRADKGGEAIRRMCPFNFDGRCSLYDNRPMICRLHGIPHELHHPGRSVSYGPGCDEFTRICGQGDYHKFDRTPHYFALANLENRFKNELGFSGKIKVTIAEMIVTFEGLDTD